MELQVEGPEISKFGCKVSHIRKKANPGRAGPPGRTFPVALTPSPAQYLVYLSTRSQSQFIYEVGSWVNEACNYWPRV